MKSWYATSVSFADDFLTRPFCSATLTYLHALLFTGGAQRERRFAPAVARYGLFKEQVSRNVQMQPAVVGYHEIAAHALHYDNLTLTMCRNSGLSLYTSTCRSMRALHFTGTDNIEQAVGWIVEHEEDPDLDTPLLIPQVLTRTSNFDLHGSMTC